MPCDNIETIKPILPEGFEISRGTRDNLHRILGPGAKPCPATLLFSHGFVQTFSPKAAIADEKAQVMHTFTR